MKQNYLNNIPVDETLSLYLGAVKEAVGERKTELYWQPFTDAVKKFLAENPHSL